MTGKDDPRALASHLGTKYLGRAYEHHESLASTNDRAWEWCEEGAPHGAVVRAEEQSAGRGRVGRVWDSPSGGALYVSVILKPAAMPFGLGALGLVVGLALRDALCSLSSESEAIALKWPNDLLVGGRKIAGILCEARWMGSTPRVVVGFGLNLTRDDFPEDLRDKATSLAVAFPGVDWSESASVLARILGALELQVERYLESGFAPIRSRYAAHCNALGREVAISMGDGSRRRVFVEGLEDDGALRVRTLDEGTVERVQAGEIFMTAM